MKIRITGLTDEIEETVKALIEANVFDVIEVSAAYPNRGASRLVRVYIDAQLHADSEPGQ